MPKTMCPGQQDFIISVIGYFFCPLPKENDEPAEKSRKIANQNELTEEVGKIVEAFTKFDQEIQGD